MKKALLIIVCAMGMASCGRGIEGGTKTGSIGDYNIKVIDGCEYIELDKGSGEGRYYSLTHKGNCINHIK